MPKSYPRAERVEALAKAVLSEAIQDLKDPRVGFVTVTGVKLSGDLRKARVFVSALGSPKERDQSIEAVTRAASHLRAVLGSEVRMRYLPQLEIVEDQTAEYGERIERILREVGVSRPPVDEDKDPDGDTGDEAAP